jgi:hypothetical protein
VVILFGCTTAVVYYREGKKQMSKIAELFETKVSLSVNFAKLIAWDGCHKIYLAMDDTQATWFEENYEHTLRGDSETLYDTLNEWWDDSCSLRFISAVSTNEDDPNEGFVTLVGQFADDEDEDEDDY